MSLRTRRKGVVRADTRNPDVHWAAILVEAKRVNGWPTQEHVAYLGGITESAIEILPQRCYFWNGVTECLDQLGDRVSPDERLRIETAVADRVPLPTRSSLCKPRRRQPHGSAILPISSECSKSVAAPR